MKNLAGTAAVLGFAGVAFGAFGAHALRARLAAAEMLSAWETAVLYHLVHAVALFALALGARGTFVDPRSQRWARWAGRCWVAGLLGFSGSLYLLALGGPRWLGPVTPLGGLALLAGWILAAGACWRAPGTASR